MQWLLRWLPSNGGSGMAANAPMHVVNTHSATQPIECVWVKEKPEELEDGKLYICPDGDIIWQQCPCGCGEEVIIAMHPKAWVMLFDGYVTIRPSIGLPHRKCRSHYFITKNQVQWCEPFVD